jgi:hypothetical protein
MVQKFESLCAMGNVVIICTNQHNAQNWGTISLGDSSPLCSMYTNKE